MHLLPPEILSEIFILCSPPSPELYHDKLPLDLIRVCKHWREVALNTPLMWTVLKFDFFDKRSRRPKEIARGVSWWINQSYPLPISISAKMVEWSHFDSAKQAKMGLDTVDRVIQAMCDASDRWKEIEVVVLFKYAKQIVDAANAGSTSCARFAVEAFNACYDNNLDGESMDYPALTLPDIPEIHIRNLRVSVKRSLSSIRYLNIKDEQNGFSDGLAIHLMACCPNLERVCMYFMGDMEYQGDPVVARKLVSMDLNFSLPVDTYSYGLFQRLTAPSLTTLCITELSNDPSILPVKDFLVRSGCQLRQFYYCSARDGDDLNIFYDLYKGLPSLEAIGLSSPASSEGLDQFLVDLGDTRCMPRLSNFIFEVEPQMHKSFMQSLRDFAECRCRKNGGELETITILVGVYLDEHMDPVVGAGIGEEISKMGVKFSFELKNMRSPICVWDY